MYSFTIIKTIAKNLQCWPC